MPNWNKLRTGCRMMLHCECFVDSEGAPIIALGVRLGVYIGVLIKQTIANAHETDRRLDG